MSRTSVTGRRCRNKDGEGKEVPGGGRPGRTGHGAYRGKAHGAGARRDRPCAAGAARRPQEPGAAGSPRVREGWPSAPSHLAGQGWVQGADGDLHRLSQWGLAVAQTREAAGQGVKACSDAGEALKPEARTLRRNPHGNEETPRNSPGHLEERVCHLQGRAHVNRADSGQEVA